MEPLSRIEMEALRILWEQGELKAAEIEAAFEWPVDNGTLRSVLKVLMQKEFVSRDRIGKAFVYRTTRNPDAVLLDTVRDLAGRFTSGSVANLLSRIIDCELLSEQELSDLQQYAKRKKKVLRKGRSTKE